MFYAERPVSVVRGEVGNLVEAVPAGRRAFVVSSGDVAARVRQEPRLRVREVDRAPYLAFQFRRLIRTEGPPMKDLVLLAVERAESAGVPPR
jgi:hypothetical protein